MTAPSNIVRVARLPAEIPQGQITESTVAVVIDTLRFTTCATWALAAGAKRIFVESSVPAARNLRAELPSPALLCGERHCRPIEGFDLGNSPAEYTAPRVRNQTLVFTTTNGTRAVAAVAKSGVTYLACMANRQAVSRMLATHRDAIIWLVCAGTEGEVAEEDLLVAGGIVEALQWPTDQAGREAQQLWRRVVQRQPARQRSNCRWPGDHRQANSSRHHDQSPQSGTGGGDRQSAAPGDPQAIVDLFRTTRGGKNLLAAGYADDLFRAAQLDTLEAVPTRHANQDAFVDGAALDR